MAVEPEVASLARVAAARLSELDPSLPATIEAEIAREEAEPARTFLDPTIAIGLATLLLGVVQFGYQVRRDRKADQQISGEALKRRIRVELEGRGYPDGPRRQAVIDAAVAAIEDGRR